MTNYSFTFNEDQVAGLAAGMCPRSVQSLAQFALESDEARLARNALKPIATRKKTAQKKLVPTVQY